MSTPNPATLGVGEFHPFEASGQRFAYMVPSAAVFAFDDCSTAVVDLLRERPQTPAELLATLGDRFSPAELRDTLTELHRVRAIEDQLVRAAGAEDHPAGADADPDAGGQRHQPVQPVVRGTATSTARTRSSTPRTAASPSS